MKNGMDYRTRGVRNNNPFNIKVSPNRWKGKLPQSEKKDKTFEEFYNMSFGIRAGVLLLKHYIQDGYNTVESIISRYAPSNENHTQNYIEYVSSFIVGDDNVPFSPPIIFGFEEINFYHLCYAICMYESNYKLSPTKFRETFKLFPELNNPIY